MPVRPSSEPVKPRRAIDEQLSLALLADILSLQENIDGAAQTVAVRGVGAVDPALAVGTTVKS